MYIRLVPRHASEIGKAVVGVASNLIGDVGFLKIVEPLSPIRRRHSAHYGLRRVLLPFHEQGNHEEKQGSILQRAFTVPVFPDARRKYIQKLPPIVR